MSTNLKKILVVDDDPVVGKSFERVLGGKGYAVITAGSGEEALKKLGTEAYDLVFTDIKMPGMSGIEVAERVKAKQPWLPVVIVTGYGSPASEARAKELGVAGFLNKPLSPEMIEGSARQAMTWKAADFAAPAPAAKPAEPLAAAQAEAAPRAGRTAKDVALFVAAPFIGLAYAIAFPIVGLVLLVRYGYQAMTGKPKAK